MAGGVPLWEDTYEPDPNFVPVTPEESAANARRYFSAQEEKFAAWALRQRANGVDDSRAAFEEEEEAERRKWGLDD